MDCGCSASRGDILYRMYRMCALPCSLSLRIACTFADIDYSDATEGYLRVMMARQSSKSCPGQRIVKADEPEPHQLTLTFYLGNVCIGRYWLWGLARARTVRGLLELSFGYRIATDCGDVVGNVPHTQRTPWPQSSNATCARVGAIAD